MTTPNFCLNYTNIKTDTLDAFRQRLQATPKKTVGDIKILELCAMTEYPNGLYFFFDEDGSSLQYIGKSTSRSFIERIPAHFDQREDSWFNTLPKRLAETSNTPYRQAHQQALAFQIILLGISDGKMASNLERIFRHSYRPCLNTPKTIQAFPMNVPLETI